jgi:hypothetical protein
MKSSRAFRSLLAIVAALTFSGAAATVAVVASSGAAPVAASPNANSWR